jgi:hypothetical protein
MGGAGVENKIGATGEVAVWVGFALMMGSTIMFAKAAYHSRSKVGGRASLHTHLSPLGYVEWWCDDAARYSAAPIGPRPLARLQTSRIYHYLTTVVCDCADHAS